MAKAQKLFRGEGGKFTTNKTFFLGRGNSVDKKLKVVAIGLDVIGQDSYAKFMVGEGNDTHIHNVTAFDSVEEYLDRVVLPTLTFGDRLRLLFTGKL